MFLLSALPEDEWFVETAKGAIHKLMSEASDTDDEHVIDEHIILHDEDSDSDDSPSSLSSVESYESFASANMGDLESPTELIDPESWNSRAKLIITGHWNALRCSSIYHFRQVYLQIL